MFLFLAAEVMRANEVRFASRERGRALRLIARKSRHQCRLATRVWPLPIFSTQSRRARVLSGRRRATGPVALRRGDAPPLLQRCRLPAESYGRDRSALETLWDSWSPSVEMRR